MTDLEMAQQRRHNKIAQETNNRIKLTLTTEAIRQWNFIVNFCPVVRRSSYKRPILV